MLPDTVTCYVDSTVFLPLLTAYALATRPARSLRRLMDRLPSLMQGLHAEYQSKRRDEGAADDTSPAAG